MPLEPYNEEFEREQIKSRYLNTPKAIHYTLERLRQSPEFPKTLQRLRVEGWKDWHVLLAIFNGVLNWHIARAGANTDFQRTVKERDAVFRRLMKEGEAADDPPVPLEEFSFDAMQGWLNASIIRFIENKGAVIRSGLAYDFSKIRRIVEKRYHYFTLDVTHEPLFPEELNGTKMA